MVCLPKLRPIKYIKHFYHLQSFKVLLLTYSHTMCIVCRRILFFPFFSVPSDANVFGAFVVHNLIHDLQLHTHKQANDSISQWQIFQHYYCVLICRLLKLVCMIVMHFLSFALLDGRQILLTVCQTIVGAYMVDAKTCVNWTSEWMKLRPLYFVLLLFLLLQRIHNGIHEPYFAKLCLYQIYSIFLDAFSSRTASMVRYLDGNKVWEKKNTHTNKSWKQI